MIINFNRSNLSDALSVVIRAVPSKSTLTAIEGIYIKAAGSTINLTGYNLDMGISTSFRGVVEKSGEIVLNAKLLFEIIRKLPDNNVTITVDDKNLTNIVSGAAEYTILGTPAEEFPQLPDISTTENITISQKILKSMITQTYFAISISEDKPVHTGALFQIEDQNLTVVAVDGFRLALRKEKISYIDKLKFVVPRTTLLEVSRILVDSDEQDAVIMASKRHIIFNIGDYMIVSRLLEGEFLDYKTAIPSRSSTTVECGVRQIIESIERTSLLISDKVKSPLRVKFFDDNMLVSCTTALGKASDVISVGINGDNVEMGFNHKYLLDALKACDGDKTKMEISGALSPMKILPLESDAYLFLVLPIRIRSE